MERCFGHPATGLGEADANHAPIRRASKRPNQPAGVQLVNHQGDTRLRRLDEFRKVALNASLTPGSAGLEEEVVLQRAQVMLRERAIDLDHRLPESAPEDRREAQIVDRGVLKEVSVSSRGLSLGRDRK